MFNEQFFDHLDHRVDGYRARAGLTRVAVVVRTHWGLFNVAKVRAEELVLGLSIYVNEPGEGEAPPPEVPEGKPRFAEMWIPYAEIVSCELYPGAEETEFVGGAFGEEEPLIGFGR